MRKKLQIVAFLLLASWPVFAQVGPTLVSAVYGPPTGVPVAPGQIVQLQVTGLKTVLPANARFQAATSVPLPTVLAGISVIVNQTFVTAHVETDASYKAAMVSVNQMVACSHSVSPDCIKTFITVQIPYELTALFGAGLNITTEIVISENGVASQPFFAGAMTDQLHVVTTCDGHAVSDQGVCHSIVAHADGTMVSEQSPAKPGEVVVIYAWGLGQTLPAVKTGEATPSPAPVVPGYYYRAGGEGKGATVAVRFDFSPNAAATFLYENPPAITADAFLTPGQVGLYQVNVQLPTTFPAVLPCMQSGGQFVQSNLTINLSGHSSHDGAAVCVAANL